MAEALHIRLTFPQRVIFGPGALKVLGDEVGLLGKRPGIIAGQRSLRASGRLEEISNSLRARGLEPLVFDGVEPEPTVQTVQRCVEFLRGSDADCAVAIGGGSVIDVGKAAACIAALEGAAREYFEGRAIPGPGLPFVALPTTSGTGAEATKNSVLRDPDRRLKTSLRNEHMIPRVAIVDPDLTLDLPPHLTAQTGMDAFTQALESHASLGASPATDGLSVEAARLVGANLLAAYHNGRDAKARGLVSLGSLLAGMALNNAGVGLVHGMAHPIGALFHLPHGLVCAVLLPAVIEFNRPACEGKYRRIEEALALEDGDLSAFARRLNADMEIAPKLSALGVNQSPLDRIIADTLPAGSTKANPRKVGADEVRSVFMSLI
jgi:alcohol dehydrogenase class IV